LGVVRAEDSRSVSSKGLFLMQVSVKFWSVMSIGLALAMPLRAEVLYLANTDGNAVSAYNIKENGTLKPVPGSPFPCGRYPIGIAVDQPGGFLFTANADDSTVSVYRIWGNGGLTHLSGLSAVPAPRALAVDPFGRFLYVTNADGSGIPLRGGTVGHVSVYRIGVNGALTPVPGSPFPAAFGPLSIVADPTGRFVYVGDVGSAQAQTEMMSAYRVEGNGALTPLPGSPYVNGNETVSMAVDPLGRFVYAAGEFDLALATYNIRASGIPVPLPASTFSVMVGVNSNDTVVADPFGRFVYQSIAGNGGGIAINIYRVSATGLTPSAPFSAGFYSDYMAVDCFGQFLFAAVTAIPRPSGSGLIEGTGLAIYRIGSKGTLTPVNGSPFNPGFPVGPMAVSP
jgi:6-phosphogluconolactonase (cycloisomerase 2 family)